MISPEYHEIAKVLLLLLLLFLLLLSIIVIIAVIIFSNCNCRMFVYVLNICEDMKLVLSNVILKKNFDII